MSRHATPSSRSQGALGRAGALSCLLPLAFVVSGCTSDESAPVDSLGAVVEPGRIEMTGSGFAITIPDGWTVEVAEPDPDVLAASPGTAWWALKASAPHRFMACSLAVGVTDLPSDRWSTVGQEGGTTPYWDPSKPWKLRVPTPDIPQSTSDHTSWIRPQSDQEADLEHDVLYALECAANEVRVGGSGRFWGPLVSSFEFLGIPPAVIRAPRALTLDGEVEALTCAELDDVQSNYWAEAIGGPSQDVRDEAEYWYERKDCDS